MEFPSIANPAHSKKTNTFIDGCTHFRVESMKAHQVSEPHLLYPTQRVAEGIMFLTRPSVSPVFLVSATPLKPLNRIS